MVDNNVIVLLVVLFILYFFYNLYKAKLERDDVNFSYQQIKDFLNDTNRENKPILWIYLKYEKNARNWESFYSRNSFDLNQGYLYLTVRSIIEHCKKSFHICLIDDNVFSKLLDDGYLKNLNKKAVPNKDYLRISGMCELLYTYGGIMVPSSFICFTNLERLLEKDDKMFVGEFANRAVQKTYFAPSYQLMGCRQSNKMMKSLVKYVQKEMITDFTEEPKFIGKINIWLNLHVTQGEIRLVDGAEIGTKKKTGIPLNVEDLMSVNFPDLDCRNRLGLYIPEDELLQRIQYGWFIRMSPRQVLESNIYVGKMLLLANSEIERNNNPTEFFQIK